MTAWAAMDVIGCECGISIMMNAVSAVTRVGGSRSHGDNEPSVVNTDEETELLFVSGGDGRMEK